MSNERELGVETLLRESAVSVIIPVMSKQTEQVRIPTELTRDARIIAAEIYGESLPEVVARALSELIARDFPTASKKIAERAKPKKPHRNGGDA